MGCLFLLVSFIEAQQVFQYEQYTSEKGLSENVVYCLHKDKKGFLWAGTDHGLNRFDGYQFKKYFPVPGDTASLSSYSILSVHEDEKGRFWLGTYSGLNYFDPETGRVKRIKIPGRGINYPVEAVQILHNGELLVWMDFRQVFLYNSIDHTLKMMSLPTGLTLSSFNSFYLPEDKPAFFCTDSASRQTKIISLEQDSRNWKVSSLLEIFPFIKEEFPVLLTSDSAGRYYVFSDSKQSLNVYNSKGEQVASLPQALQERHGGFIVFTSFISDTAAYFATNKGLLLYDMKRRTFAMAELKGDSKSLAGNKEIRCLLNDRKGSTWMGTFGEGLLRVDNRKLFFNNIPLPEISADRFRRMIFGLYRWAGDTIAAETGFNNFVFIRNGKITGFVSNVSITFNEIVKVTTGKEVAQLSPFQTSSLKQLFSSRTLYPYRFALHDDTTILYFAERFSVRTPSGIRDISTGFLVGNMADDGNYYWFPSGQGLHRIRKSDLADSLYQFEKGNPGSLSSSGVYHIALDEKKNIWFGTKGGGLNHFDPGKNKFFRYTTRDGLTDDVIYMVLPDGKGSLWLTTNQGISRFNIASKTFTNFSRRDGLLNTEFNRQGAVMTQDGIMYLSGTSGIDYFRPDEIGPTSPPATVIFSELRLNNEVTAIRENLRLPSYMNTVSISYSANDFIRPDLVYYRYRLNSNNPWTIVRGINTATFSAIQPGSYRFEVQSSYDNQSWSSSSFLGIFIKTPWWKSGWFYGLFAATVLLLLFLFYRYRINQLKKMLAMRIKISQDLHDEVGATLSGVTLMSELTAKKIKSGEIAGTDQLVERIKDESKEMAEKMNDIVWAINPVNDSMEKVLSKIQGYGNNLCTSAGIQFHFSKPEIRDGVLNMQVRNNIYLISKEAINNAVKYSGARNIRFIISGKKNNYVLRIEDDGMGFDTQAVNCGNGLANIRSRASEIGGDVNIRSGKDNGTLLELHF